MTMTETAGFLELHAAINERRAVVGVIGLGYVGLPLAVATARAGFVTGGFDTDPAKPSSIAAGQSYIDAVRSVELARLVAEERLSATSDLTGLSAWDVVIICV